MKKEIITLTIKEQKFVYGGVAAKQDYGKDPEKVKAGQGYGKGPGGSCVCPKCGEKLDHQRGVPCTSMSCTKCDLPMVRE